MVHDNYLSYTDIVNDRNVTTTIVSLNECFDATVSLHILTVFHFLVQNIQLPSLHLVSTVLMIVHVDDITVFWLDKKYNKMYSFCKLNCNQSIQLITSDLVNNTAIDI